MENIPYFCSFSELLFLNIIQHGYGSCFCGWKEVIHPYLAVGLLGICLGCAGCGAAAYSAPKVLSAVQKWEVELYFIEVDWTIAGRPQWVC